MTRVVGQNETRRRLELEIAQRDLNLPNSWDFSIIVDWPNIESLKRSIQASSGPVMLVENAGAGSIAVGPIFDRRRPGCFSCYLARRRANGAHECRPPRLLTDRAVAIVINEMLAYFDARAAMRVEQVEVPDVEPLVRHALLPCPGCECGTRGATPRLTVEELIGARVGVVHNVSTTPSPGGTTRAIAIGCRTDAFGPVRALNRGMAVDTDVEAARFRAAIESVERYCGAACTSEAIFAAPADLEGDYLDPGLFPSVRFDRADSSELRWVKATRLSSGAPVWVPAALVFVPFENPIEPVLGAQTSVGLAGGLGMEDATPRALFEVIERDQCLRSWRLGIPVLRVDSRPLPLTGLHLCAVPTRSNLAVVVAFLEQDSPPFSSTGIGAELNIENAARKATLEALQARLFLEDWLVDSAPVCPIPPRTMMDNALAHALCGPLAAARQTWLHPKANASLNARESSWAEIVADVPGACVVDVTTPDVAAAGVSVVRVLAPGRVTADDDALNPVIGGRTEPHPFG